MTIKDIARESGYSVGTVSRVLNNQAGVSERSREAVMKVVDKYHFKLNSNAKNLKKQSEDGIAIIVKGTQNMFFSALVEPMQGLVEKKGYAFEINYSGEDDDEMEIALQICRERRPQGILFLGCNINRVKEMFENITIPCVLVTNDASNLEFDNLSSVRTDDYGAAKMAVDYLISHGHTNIGILGGMRQISSAADGRYEGCIDAFHEHGMEYNEKRQYEQSYFTITDGYNAMERLLDKMPDITAVFAMSDVMAIGAVRAVYDRGMKVPADISIIGFDGIDIGKYTNPRLTTIRQSREKIASRSVEILLDCIENRSGAVYEIVPFYFVKGESVKSI